MNWAVGPVGGGSEGDVRDGVVGASVVGASVVPAHSGWPELVFDVLDFRFGHVSGMVAAADERPASDFLEA